MYERVLPYQAGPGVVTATGGETAAAQVDDGAGEQQADDAAQQDGGVGAFHHPMKHKGLRPGRVGRK